MVERRVFRFLVELLNKVIMVLCMLLLCCMLLLKLLLFIFEPWAAIAAMAKKKTPGLV